MIYIWNQWKFNLLKVRQLKTKSYFETNTIHKSRACKWYVKRTYENFKRQQCLLLKIHISKIKFSIGNFPYILYF